MNTRISIAILSVAAMPLPHLMAQDPNSSETQKNVYIRQTFGLNAVTRTVGAAGLAQIQGKPHEWGGGVKGFGKRLASGFGSHLVKHTIQFGVATVRHERLGYQRSQDQGFGKRMRHALVATVIVGRTDREGNTIATGHFAGVFGAGFISRLWQPARLHTISSGFLTSGLIFASDAGGNVLREFWPEIRHPRRKRNVVPRPSVTKPDATVTKGDNPIDTNNEQ
jgi:hypothetical protein